MEIILSLSIHLTCLLFAYPFYLQGKGSRVVATMAKKSVGDLSKADLEGKVVFVRADLNVSIKSLRGFGFSLVAIYLKSCHLLFNQSHQISNINQVLQYLCRFPLTVT
jgi:hypothetical protein